VTVLPQRFLFRVTIAVPCNDAVPHPKGRGLRPSEVPPLPSLSELEGEASPFTIGVCWNERGLGVATVVTGKRRPPVCNPARPDASDGLRVWIDTRCTQNIHRATRFCHCFHLAPAGDDAGTKPWAVQVPVPRAKDDAPRNDKAPLQVWSKVGEDGYDIACWLPADALHGFDPAAQPRLGFCCAVTDAEFGRMCPFVPEEFPYESDPSLWATLELAGG